jgi:LPS export ABC transporter protein LptC
MNWQKRARIGVAVFGIAFALVVFFAIGEREKPAAAPPPTRLDPKAISETARGFLKRVTGTRQDYEVTFEHLLAYEDNNSKLANVRIDVRGKQGRDFVITGAEALANDKTREINISRNVKLVASDGFELTTDSASFRESDGIVRTPGTVAFKKGTMSGTGVGMTYDKNADVLTILDQAKVLMTDNGGNRTGEFASGSATLARQENYLALEKAVHALHGEQTIDADRAKASLTENEDKVTFIELRGSARVAGGSAGFDSMSARDIDLDYADDGQTIERVVLAGNGAMALKGKDGAPGRQMLGDSLTISLAPDGAVTSAIGRDGVQFDLPGSDTATARQVRAKQFDAVGEAGKGMTSAKFGENVEYREEKSKTAPGRSARSQTLSVELDGDAISHAAFTGQVQFEEQGLKASAAEATYDPAKGTLHLVNADKGGGPRVADERISIESETIDVTLEGRKMIAKGNVKTLLQGTAKTPGLLKKDQPANVSAANLTYEGDPGRAVYSGSAQLWQGETAIRGDTITIDQDKGALNAIGSARSTLALSEGGTSIGRAEEIRYDDAARRVYYIGKKAPLAVVSATPPPPTPPLPPPAAPAPTAPAPAPATEAAPPLPIGPVPAQMSGPQGDLRADRLVVVLAKDETRMERLEASGGVELRVDQRTATGARLTYHTIDDRYEIEGTTTIPVVVVEGCRETTGRTLTFFKSTDRIIVDGNEEIRTRTTSGGPCPQPRPE